MPEMGLAKFYTCTEFEVSNSSIPNLLKRVLNLKILPLDPDHAPF